MFQKEASIGVGTLVIVEKFSSELRQVWCYLALTRHQVRVCAHRHPEQPVSVLDQEHPVSFLVLHTIIRPWRYITKKKTLQL